MTNAPDNTAGKTPLPATGPGAQDQARKPGTDDIETKKPEELTEEELRLMADTMPGEGPGDD